tara:strand:+ start:341 stop:631 length:291 start_codon:yes stop_codon:yes gene_type:complete
MNFGGTNVWTNFSYSSHNDPPSGCLLNKKGDRLISFNQCRKSLINDTKVFTHLFYTNHLREPAALINTRLLDVNCAFETWEGLVNNGWTKVKNYFG